MNRRGEKEKEERKGERGRERGRQLTLHQRRENTTSRASCAARVSPVFVPPLFSRRILSLVSATHTRTRTGIHTSSPVLVIATLSLSLLNVPLLATTVFPSLSLSLSLSPYESRVLPSPSPAVLSLSLSFSLRAPSLSLSLSPRVSFSPAFLTARVRSLLHEGGETSVALRGSTRARAESRLIADAECAERFLRGVSLCILLLHVRPYD